MRKLITCLLLALAAASQPASADGEPGVFDYWLLSLSWSPQYCIDNERDPQCTRVYNFVVHGLWPQYEDGYPSNCLDVERIDRPLIERMLPLMPSPPLIQNEWRKHGSCSGLEAKEYFLTVERAHRALIIPAEYVSVDNYLNTSIDEIKGNFMRSNPALTPESMALICSGRYLKEFRVCFDKEFEPRECAADVHDRCGKRVTLRPTR